MQYEKLIYKNLFIALKPIYWAGSNIDVSVANTH
jgi:hypothetical protein